MMHNTRLPSIADSIPLGIDTDRGAVYRRSGWKITSQNVGRRQPWHLRATYNEQAMRALKSSGFYVAALQAF